MESLKRIGPKRVPEITLGTLAERLKITIDGKKDTAVRGITLDSGKVLPQDIFAALPGQNRHGAIYAAEAAKGGAVAILTDLVGQAQIAELGVELPVILDENPRVMSGYIAREIYRTEKAGLPTIGITGTNGKTMTAYLVEAVLTLFGKKIALSSTAQRKLYTTVLASDLTTPEACDLHAFLALAAEEKIDTAVIEVSAQAYTHSRVAGVKFDSMSFLNLSHDHLDDYHDFEEYYQAKKALFDPEISQSAVIVMDTEWGQRLAQEVTIPKLLLWHEEEFHKYPPSDEDWILRIDEMSIQHSQFRLTHPASGKEISASIEFFGRDIIVDTAVAILQVMQTGIAREELQRVLQDHPIPWNIPGRMQVLTKTRRPIFILDYGHTPEAFRSSLSAIRSVYSDRLVMLFGADGDRDPSKREDMAKHAAEFADAVVITDYNPRFEDASAIRKTLMDAIRRHYPEREAHELQDQSLAVRKAIEVATDQGMVLWAGPGHEEYREVAGRKEPYSARVDAIAALEEAGWRK